MKIEEHDGPNLCLNCRRRLRTCFVAQQLDLIKNPPAYSYRKKTEGRLTQRGISKKWQKRKVFYL